MRKTKLYLVGCMSAVLLSAVAVGCGNANESANIKDETWSPLMIVENGTSGTSKDKQEANDKQNQKETASANEKASKNELTSASIKEENSKASEATEMQAETKKEPEKTTEREQEPATVAPTEAPTEKPTEPATEAPTKPSDPVIYCIGSGVNIRKGAGTEFESIGVMNVGDKLHFISSTMVDGWARPWYYGTTDKGVTGWVYGEWMYVDSVL